MKKNIFFLTGLLACLILNSPAQASLDKDSGFVLPQYSAKISLDFKGADLKDVLKAFSRQIAMNFLLEQDVDVKGITVLLDNVPVEEALSKILTAYGLVYEYDVPNNILLVKKKKEEEEKDDLMTRVYQLKFASVPGSAVAREMGGTGTLSGGLEAGGGGGGGKSSGGIMDALKAVVKDKGSVEEDPRTNSLVITDVPENFPKIERLLARLDVPVPTVLIEVEMMDVSKTNTDNLGVNWQLGVVFTATGMRSIRSPFESIDDPANPIRNNIRFDTVGSLLEFLKKQDDTKTLARPRIMTSDNQTAIIRISTDEAIGEKCNTQTGTSTSTTCEAERYETGVVMKVTPQVSLLTDEITLIVEPKVVEASRPVTFEQTYMNPEERGIKSILRVKSGETIIMGGLLRLDEIKSISKVPFLGDLPFVGNAFKRTETKKTERELMVFITPRILGSSEEMRDSGRTAENVLKGEQSGADTRAGMIRQEMDLIANK